MKKLKILVVLMTILITTNVHAALQSRPGVDHKGKTTASDFFKLMREMETEGGSFGLNATFAENTSTGEYEETSAPNNIDTHMCKNTEWGTAAMLSASKYGAGNGKVEGAYNSSTKTYGKSASTTGNMSGIFGMQTGSADYEYVAGGIISKMDKSKNKYLISAHSRYVDSYEDSNSSSMDAASSRYIPGDATYETYNFHYTILCSFVYSSGPVFARGFLSLFSSDDRTGTVYQGNPVSSRLVVWSGEGI